MTKSESRIQQEIIRYYRNNFCLKHHDPQHIIFSVPNEMAATTAGELTKLGVPKKTIQRFSSMLTGVFKATGLLSGVSDLIVIQPQRVLFVEVKTPTGTQSKSQKWFQQTVERLGFLYFIVHDLEEFKKII